LWVNRRSSIDLSLDVLHWLMLALALPWFVWMGGYIKGLRTQLRERNAELERALQTATVSEGNLAEAQRIARIGMWIVDPVARNIDWSAETYRLFELDQNKGVPIGREFTRLIHPDDQQRYRELIRPALLEGRSFDSEFRVMLPLGGVRWLHALGVQSWMRTAARQARTGPCQSSPLLHTGSGPLHRSRWVQAKSTTNSATTLATRY